MDIVCGFGEGENGREGFFILLFDVWLLHSRETKSWMEQKLIADFLMLEIGNSIMGSSERRRAHTGLVGNSVTLGTNH